MLRRLYIDNYKSFVDFEYKPGKRELLLGDNGTGKSSIFELLAGLRELLVEGKEVGDVFSRSTLTRWQKHYEQKIELEIESPNGVFEYYCVIRHDQHTRKVIVEREGLVYNKKEQIKAINGNVTIYEFEDTLVEFPLISTNRSSFYFISQIATNDGFAPVNWFLDWLKSIIIVRINPYNMSSWAEDESQHPSVDLNNYVSWYRHLIQEKTHVITETTQMLKDIIPGFDSLNLQREGEQTRILKVLISTDSQSEKYDLGELSEGQRSIIALYTLIGVLKDEPGLLCIDEPDNFVSIKEIQPWLLKIEELTECHGAQVLIISHHPEVINFLAPSAATRFYRQDNGPVCIKAFEVNQSNEGLLPSEIVARGWEND